MPSVQRLTDLTIWIPLRNKKTKLSALMLDPIELFPEVPNLYEFPSVHADMLYDAERMSRYKDAIAAVVKEGDIVADIGTGTGLLAFLCIQAGAARVHAIERSSAINWAEKLARINGFVDQIAFYRGDSRSVVLPEKVDVVISELIGHMAFEEGMVESLLDAKQRFLAPGGMIIPEKVRLQICLVSATELYQEAIDRWEPLMGLDFSVLREEAVKACYVTDFNDQNLLSETQTAFVADLSSGYWPSTKCKRILRACRRGMVHGLGMWFEATLAPQVQLSSSPWSPTHWKQCFAPIPEPMELSTGDNVEVGLALELRKSPADVFRFELSMRKLD
jgi:precorrin-6B methylase 2